ncbi:MAG: MoaD/ThiS family protein [Thermodesulfobacteriota bacterium]
MRVTVNFSSLFRILSGVEQVKLDVAEGTTIDGLCKILAQKYQDLPVESQKTFFLINGQISRSDQVISEGDRVRMFQLSAGG